MKKRFLLALSISLIALLIIVGSVSAASSKNIAVCHYDVDAATYYLINISAKAVNTHLTQHVGLGYADYEQATFPELVCYPEVELLP